MKASFVVAIISAAFVVVAYPKPAAASFTVCNKTSFDTVTVAFAARWFDADKNVKNGSRGWYAIAKGSCSVLIPTDISAYDMFIYAYATSDATKTWSGDHPYCLNPAAKFTYDGDGSRPPCSEGREFGMQYVETSGLESFTEDLTD